MILFDISSVPSSVWMTLTAMATLCVALIALWRRSVFLVAGAVLSTLLLATGFSYRVYQVNRLRARLVDGKLAVVEGRIHNFRPMPKEGHQEEQFCVANDCFHYSQSTELWGGVAHTKAHGYAYQAAGQVSPLVTNLDIERPRLTIVYKKIAKHWYEFDLR